jgi:hypothetical protein
MKNRVSKFSQHAHITNKIISSHPAQYGYEFGLTYEMLFNETVIKAQAQGLLAGQAASLFHLTKIK